MENYLQINDTQQPDAAIREAQSSLSASMFIVDEFRYKCLPDKDGNVNELIITDIYDSSKAEEMRKLGAPRSPQYDTILKTGAPSEQVYKPAFGAKDNNAGASALKPKEVESPTKCN